MVKVGEVWEKVDPVGDYWQYEEYPLVIVTKVTENYVKYRCHVTNIVGHYKNIRPLKEFESMFALHKSI